MGPRNPVYVVSKGRADRPMTIRALEAMGVSPYVVVEAKEREAYEKVVRPGRTLVLDRDFQTRLF